MHDVALFRGAKLINIFDTAFKVPTSFLQNLEQTITTIFKNNKMYVFDLFDKNLSVTFFVLICLLRIFY